MQPTSGDAPIPASIRVLAAVIRRGDLYLLAKRPASKRHGGLWEFPGGKLEPGEGWLEAARRELREELGVDVTAVGEVLYRRLDPGARFEIVFVEVEIERDPEALEHEDVRWVAGSEMNAMELAPADAAFAARLGEGQGPPSAPLPPAVRWMSGIEDRVGFGGRSPKSHCAGMLESAGPGGCGAGVPGRGGRGPGSRVGARVGSRAEKRTITADRRPARWDFHLYGAESHTTGPTPASRVRSSTVRVEDHTGPRVSALDRAIFHPPYRDMPGFAVEMDRAPGFAARSRKGAHTQPMESP